MKNSPPISQVPSLTAVCQQCVKYAPSGLTAESIADFLGRKYPTLMSELGTQTDHKLGADMVLPIMQLSGSLAPMHFLARELGGVYVAMPNLDSEHPVHRQCMAAVQEFGELMAEAARALEDGVISKEEVARVSLAGDEALSAILALKAAMTKAVERT